MPHVIIIAGPNGSGKTTTAPEILRDTLNVVDYVNADVIAQGLRAFQPEKAAIQAGRIMLKQIKFLANEASNFAFETTLASRTFAHLITELKKAGYHFHLIFLWLKTVNLAISRVAERVKMGGHSIPEETIRRRYEAGLNNFFSLYQPLANSWQLYDNSVLNKLSLIAAGTNEINQPRIANNQIWSQLQEIYYDPK